MHQQEGLTFPFTQNSAPYFTSPYGWEAGRSYFHAGVDITVPEGSDENVRSIGGGRVLAAGNFDPDGYGVSVVVRTPTGHIEQFTHLAFAGVSEGEYVQPGQSIGGMGSTGRSTGPHLDFVVYKPEVGDDDWMRGNYEELTINPVDYMRTVQSLQVLPRGVGPSSLPSRILSGSAEDERIVQEFLDSLQPYRGGVVSNSVYAENPDRYFSSASPGRNPRASGFRSDYIRPGNVQVHNDPGNNYGYATIAEDRGFRIKLAQVASRLNIPAVWLADVMAYETGARDLFSPSVINPLGCVGLIQFCPSGGLADIAQEIGVSVNTARERLSRMTRASQMDWVYYYLNRYTDGGRLINTIEDLYAVINGGPGGLSMTDRSSLNDLFVQGAVQGGGYFLDHMRRMGELAGRSYYTVQDRLTGGAGAAHEEFVGGCPECARMMSNFGVVYPHLQP